MPASLHDLNNAKPQYEEIEGWNQDTSGVRRFEDLPQQAQRFVHRIEDILETPVCLVSVGPERDQAISLRGIV
jgi:adenylosuccinate synthase